MIVIAYYTAELIPRVGAWSYAQPWRDSVPFLFGWSYLLSLVSAIWHVLVNPRLGWLARLALIVSFFMLPIVGFTGYYWFGVHDRRLLGEPALAQE